jgi:hypothetical protein
MVTLATNGEAQHIQDMLNEGKIDEIKAVALLQESLTRNRSAVIAQAASTEDNINNFGRLEETLGIMGLQFDNEGKVRQTLNQTTEKQIKGQDGMTEQLIQAKKALEGFSRDMFQIAVSLMPQAATAIHMLTDTIRDFITEIQYFIKNGKFRSEEGSFGRKALQLAGGAIGAGAGIFGTGVLAGATGGAGLAASATLIGGGAALGVGAGNALADYFGLGKGGLETEFGMPAFSGSGGGGSRRPEDVLAFGSNTGDAQHFAMLDPSFQKQVLAAADQYYQATGKKLQINSAGRNSTEQQKLYEGGKGAPPGSSNHEKGMAVDIQNYNDNAALSALGAQGLRQSVPGEPWHFSMAYGGIVSGPKSGYQGMLHGDEAVVPLAGGRSIPVEQPALTGSLQEQIGLLADNNNLLSELISLMSSNNSISSKILQVARG